MAVRDSKGHFVSAKKESKVRLESREPKNDSQNNPKGLDAEHKLAPAPVEGTKLRLFSVSLTHISAGEVSIQQRIGGIHTIVLAVSKEHAFGIVYLGNVDTLNGKTLLAPSIIEVDVQ